LDIDNGIIILVSAIYGADYSISLFVLFLPEVAKINTLENTGVSLLQSSTKGSQGK